MAGLMFIAKPSLIRMTMLAEARRVGAIDLLGATLFPVENWHQSLSNRQVDQPHLREAMLLAGASVKASAVTMKLNRIVTSGDQPGRIHWSFQAQGKPRGFSELKAAVRAALAQQGIQDATDNKPHITLSYFAIQKQPPMIIAPIIWTIDELLLVNGGGNPYRYDVLGTWKLSPDAGIAGPQIALL